MDRYISIGNKTKLKVLLLLKLERSQDGFGLELNILIMESKKCQ